MIKMLLISFVVLSFSQAHAKSKYDDSVKACLDHWGKTPFNKSNLKYRTYSTSVNVFGAGSDIVDDKETKEPELVFIKPSVNVLGSTKIKLHNPNGWYCLKSATNVLGKATIELHCNAMLAMSNTGATVLGGDEGDQKTTTVLGKTKIDRIGCKDR